MSDGDSEVVSDASRIDHWNIKVYDSTEGFERETIRGLTLAQKIPLMETFARENIQAQAMPYTADGQFVHGHSESVNWNVAQSCSWCGGTAVNPPQSVEGYHSQMTLCDDCETKLDEKDLLVSSNQ